MEWHYGIDTAAHKGTLQAGGKTIAVLGSGINNIFPKENESLYKEILNNEGLIISEYAPNENPKSEYFLERNRIVSGLSIGVLVIEAAYRSGTSVTAKFAKMQGKKVFALPHEIKNSFGVGTNRLIQNGAILVTNIKDIIKEYSYLKYDKNKVKNDIIKKTLPDEKYIDIYNIIMKSHGSLNEIYQKSDKNVGEINHILLILELDGYIQKVSGGYKCI